MRLLPAAGLLLLACLFPFRSDAAESYDGCKYVIPSLPAVLASQGVWCLQADLATDIASGVAITITGNNVILDCNHFKIGGLAAGEGTATKGILATNRTNTVVRNCNIRGFHTGIQFSGAIGAVVEDNILDGNTVFGIQLSGGAYGSQIRRNRLFDTGGSTEDGSSAAIIATLDTHVIDNLIDGVFGDGQGDDDMAGIYTGSPTATITGNRISNLSADGNGAIRGIRNTTSGRAIIEGNYLIGHGGPIGTGISCFNDLAVARDNVILGFATGVATCTASGNFHDPD